MPILTSTPLPGQPHGPDGPLIIGFVNNMPDAALRTAERNFRELLAAASQDILIHFRMLSLPELHRGDAARSHLAHNYEDIGELWGGRLDGLIVTGAEPRAPDLTDEALWATLTRLVDWAEDRTSSVIWSCLAAHAAVGYTDGLTRHRFGEKLSGVFDCDVTPDHGIVAGIASPWRVPHSRYNELREAELVANGYCVLSRSVDAGADMFVKQRESLFIFFQGHPEYDSRALFREYRRDVGRYLAGDRDTYPEMPRNVFDEGAAAAFACFRDQALRRRSVDLLETFPTILEGQVVNYWQAPAVRVYRNWLLYLLARRTRGAWDSYTPVEKHGALAEGLA